MLAELHFPPLGHLVDWKPFALKNSELFAINKVVLVYFMAVVLTFLVFLLGGKKKLVPTGMQNVAESAVEFIEDGIIAPAVGHHAPKWLTPVLTSFFFFIFFTNIFEVIPVMQMPASARIALPMLLALIVWVLYNFAGVKEHGLFGYLKNSLFPPGVPVALYILVTPIEFVSNFLVRPFSLMVRLFANLLAGHILLATFAVLSAALWAKSISIILVPLPAFMVVFFVAFEILVAFLQAYVFTLLSAVYVGSAMSHEH